MRPRHPLSKIEKILITAAGIFGMITVFGIILLISMLRGNHGEKQPSSDSSADTRTGPQTQESTALDDITSILPDNCDLNEALPEIYLQRENGDSVSSSDFKGKITIITFWASWCPDCQQELPLVNDFLKITEQYGDINYILVNKLDNEKETKGSAEEYLAKQQINIDTYYDDGLEAYKALGLHNIPTTLFLDQEGILRAWCPRQITDVNVFEAYVRNVSEGSGKVTGQFVLQEMMDDRGGIHNVYASSREETYSSEVLSETQGAMLEYAILSENQELFRKILSYINEYMRGKDLTAWRIVDQKADDTNALIDDLRIYRVLVSANELWGGYEEDLQEYGQAIARHGVRKQRYVDFYSAKSKKYAKRFTLCYGDLKAMSALAASDPELQKPYEDAVGILSNGYISDDFPLYYSWYNYKTNAYEKDDLNSAEAMMTLLHLAEAGQLKQTTVGWLKSQMDGEGVKARYTVQGEIAEGYNYDSTAVYGLISMIADEIGDEQLQGKALRKMEKMRINNVSFAYNGAFGLEDGSGISSFDQVIAMLAYEYTK